MNRKIITLALALVSSALFAGCIPFPTQYGIVPVPVPMLIDGAIQETLRRAATPSPQDAAIIEKNRTQLWEDRELYQEKAQAGDTVSQLNLARVLFHQVFLNKTIPIFRDSVDDLYKMKEEAEAERYLQLAVTQNFAPAMTYLQCRRHQKYGKAGWPDANDIEMLEKASAVEPHAKYLLAKYVFQSGSGSAHIGIDRSRAAYLYFEAASAGDMDALVELQKLRRSELSANVIAMIDSPPDNLVRWERLSAAERQRMSVCSDEFRN